MTTLSVSDLTVEFVSGAYKVRPFQNLSFEVSDGELLVLLGPSGCGKTTLLSCLAGLLTPQQGSIDLDGIDVTQLTGARLAAYRRDSVGVVFQAFNLIPSLSARGNVMVPLRLAGVRRGKARERAIHLLEQVDMGERADHKPDQLSGGQQQRVAIARALTQNPPLVIADEPTAHLDYIQVEGVLRLIREIASPGRLVVVATHDERITQLADRIVELTPHKAVPVSHERVSVTLDPGDTLFLQGDPSDLVYVLESGAVDVYRDLAEGGIEVLTRVQPGQYFGELGPLLNLPRSASVYATEHSVLTGYALADFRTNVKGGNT